MAPTMNMFSPCSRAATTSSPSLFPANAPYSRANTCASTSAPTLPLPTTTTTSTSCLHRSRTCRATVAAKASACACGPLTTLRHGQTQRDRDRGHLLGDIAEVVGGQSSWSGKPNAPGRHERIGGGERRRDARCNLSRRAENSCTQLADLLMEELARDENTHKRYLIAVAGCPGSGKSSFSRRLERKLNHRSHKKYGEETAIVLPMDGFHYTRAELDQMIDPVKAHRRRGSHWTINSELFVEAVRSITEPLSEGSFPSFDHAVGDPVPDDIQVRSQHQVVIVEGLYLFLDLPPWCELMDSYHKKCFIKCPIGLSLKRVMHRKTAYLNMETHVAIQQVNANDKKNAITVWKTKKNAEHFIPT